MSMASDEHEDGDERVELPQRLQPFVAPEDDPYRPYGAVRFTQSRGGTRLQCRADRAARCNVASTATSRPLSRRQLCIECDACIDICPVQCLTITENGDEARLRERLSAPSVNPTRRSTSRRVCPRPEGHGQGRERLRALRALRRALSHRGVGHGGIRISIPYAGDSGLLTIPVRRTSQVKSEVR